MSKYGIGVDFGTLSARALVVEIGTGRELATASKAYPHAVMDECLPDGQKLPPDWALQHPADYVDCLCTTVREAVEKSGIDPADVVGMGIDFTACTMAAVDENLTPLCLLPEYEHRPHAYVKLWKHHAAQKEADHLNAVAQARGEDFLARYGGKISSEWLFPKIMQTLHEDPEIYEKARFMEAGDWLVAWMTGNEARSSCLAGYKALWHKQNGYPSNEFFAALDPKLENVVDEKLSRDIRSIGSKAGELTPEAAEKLGLAAGTAVAVCNVDAHVSLPPAGITDAAKLLMIMGTSTCHILLGTEEHIVPGMCGVVEDGVVPGFLGYEAGQSCVGDHFNWFVDNCVPEEYAIAAREKGMDLHQYLTVKAAALKPGESGLLALDWWNGNRSVLVDADLTGLMLGMTLTTKPEEMYRALIEATAYGTRTIMEAFASNGVQVDEIYACGGISRKNPFLMQIYADVLGKQIRVARSAETPALGSAMFGAVAAGAENGGYDTIQEAAKEMGGLQDTVYIPNEKAQQVYDRLFAEYTRLHDLFGRGGENVMKRLKAIKKAAFEA